jgi:hypothetical protein
MVSCLLAGLSGVFTVESQSPASQEPPGTGGRGFLRPEAKARAIDDAVAEPYRLAVRLWSMLDV